MKLLCHGNPASLLAVLMKVLALQEAEVVALPRIVVKRWPGAGIDILVRAWHS